jgi:hypothetical protein
VSTFTVADRDLTMPVEVRRASQWFTWFLVDRDKAQRLIDYSGLSVNRRPADKAVVSIAAARYVDGDLGPYHEVAVAVMVDRPRGLVGGSDVGAFIHQLPVNQPFTMEAGRSIWGFPKWLARIELAEGGRRTRVGLFDGEIHVLTLSVARGIPVPFGPRLPNYDAYSCGDGRTRRVRWEQRSRAMRVAPLGATLELGSHLMADELRALALPSRGLVGGSLGRVSMTFGAAEEI